MLFHFYTDATNDQTQIIYFPENRKQQQSSINNENQFFTWVDFRFTCSKTDEENITNKLKLFLDHFQCQHTNFCPLFSISKWSYSFFIRSFHWCKRMKTIEYINRMMIQNDTRKRRKRRKRLKTSHMRVMIVSCHCWHCSTYADLTTK